MMNPNFTITEVKETGIKVKINSADVTSKDIYNFMLKDLSGVNRWKAFGDLIWFFNQCGYNKYGFPIDEDGYDTEDWEDYESDEDWESDEEEKPKVQEKPIRRKLRLAPK